MAKLPPTIQQLIQELKKLPGIGVKGAERIAFHLFHAPDEQSQTLARTLLELKKKVHMCPTCFNLTENAQCDICTNPQRDKSQLCIVESVVDLIAIEKSGAFKGLYHVLHGRISPLEGITPDDLTIDKLESRLRETEDLKEIIIATTSGVEGEATATYLGNLLKNRGLRITRIGLGIPAGGALEYADELTLRKALESRQPF